MNPFAAVPPGVEVVGRPTPHTRAVLAPAALDFVAFLERGFRARRAELMARRAACDASALPDFAPETAYIRADEHWRVPALPEDLRDRRVEITLPPDRASLRAALATGPASLLVDFEDGCAPTWHNLVEGQFNLYEAIHGEGEGEAPRGATALIVRPRGWHLDEPRLRIDGQACAAALFDFALYLFHNARALVGRGSGPYYCLPKIESRHEARLWNDILRLAEDRLSLPPGTVRVACMIETLAAAFEMDEMLHELRGHATGLVAGHRDYAISGLRVRRDPRASGKPDAKGGLLGVPDMRACKALLVATCRRRGAFAMGTANDRIPIDTDRAANEAVSDRVRRHAAEEASIGFDGMRVMHPDMAAVARAAFDQALSTGRDAAGQGGAPVEAGGLLAATAEPPPDRSALRGAIETGVRYAAAWLGGSGSVSVGNRMTDASSAELCAARVRRWIESPESLLENGSRITPALVAEAIGEVLAVLRDEPVDLRDPAPRYAEGARLFATLCSGGPEDGRLATAVTQQPD